MHLNSIISTKGAQYCTIDLKFFYLNTPMEQPELMQMKLSLSNLLPEFVELYNLNKLADHNGTVYMNQGTKKDVWPTARGHTSAPTFGTAVE